MKRLFVIALCLMFSQAIWAQKFTVPAIPGEIEETEYAKYVQDFNRCMDWLESHAPSATQRKDVNAFVVWWMIGSPDVHIEVNADAANFNNGELLVLYMGGWARHSISNPDASKADGSMAGIETVINYYLKYKDFIGKNKMAEKLIKMKKKGTLRQYMEDSLKE